MKYALTVHIQCLPFKFLNGKPIEGSKKTENRFSVVTFPLLSILAQKNRLLAHTHLQTHQSKVDFISLLAMLDYVFQAYYIFDLAQ